MAAIKKEQPEPPDWADIPGIEVLSPEEGIAYFDRRAQELLGMSGEEFLQRWDNGEFRPVPDMPEKRNLGQLDMLMPFAGRKVA